MSHSVVRTANVKWDISVPSEFDEEIRFYLASQGENKDSFSELVQKAVSRYILSSLSREKPKTKSKIQAFLKKIWKKSSLTVLLGQRTGKMKYLPS